MVRTSRVYEIALGVLTGLLWFEILKEVRIIVNARKFRREMHNLEERIRKEHEELEETEAKEAENSPISENEYKSVEQES